MRFVVAAGAALVLALVPAAVAAGGKTGFAFGRRGGSIVPFTVTIANDGRVRAEGPVTIGRHRLTPLQLANLNRVATMAGFVRLPATTNCAGVLPDVAATYVRVGPRTVRVHGECLAAYRRMWNALSAAVKLSYG